MQGKRKFVKKSNPALTLYRALRTIAAQMDLIVSNFDGKHGFLLRDERVIYLGKKEPLVRKCVILAHEIGHVIDFNKNPPSATEEKLMESGPEIYLRSTENLTREKASWKIAEELVRGTGLWKFVSLDFDHYSRTSIKEYEELTNDRARSNQAVYQ